MLLLRFTLVMFCLLLSGIALTQFAHASSKSNDAQSIQTRTQQDAEKEPPLSEAAQSARKDITKILKGPDFNRETVHKTWRFKNREELQKDEEIPQWFIKFIEFLENYFSSEDEKDTEKHLDIGAALAKLLEFLLWIVGISIVILIIYHYRDYLKSLAREITAKNESVVEKPVLLFGLDVTEESLPENVPEQVMALWRRGESREAMGLLYRATLSRLIHQYNFKFSESATEKECAEIVGRSSMKEIDTYMQKLTRLWQRLAYGHRVPSDTDVMALCDNWPEVFSDGV